MIKKLFSLALTMLVCAGVWAETANLTATTGVNFAAKDYTWPDLTKNKVLYDAATNPQFMAWSNGNALAFDTSNGMKIGNSSKESAIVFRIANAADITINVGRNGSDVTVQLYYLGESTDVLTSSNLAPGTATKCDEVAISASSATGTLEYTGNAGYYKIYGNPRFCVKDITISAATAPACPSNLTISGKKAYTEGGKIELTAALEEGNGAITYQWYKGSIAEGNKIVGATTTKLEIANCTGSNAGDYFCVASKAECEDAESAAYAVTVKAIEPTGDATITYALSGSTVTGTATGVNTISNLSTSLTLNTLTLSGTKDGYSGAIKGMNAELEKDDSKYVDVQFAVAEGYVFTPSAVSVKANPLNGTGAVKAVVAIMDAQTAVESAILACAKNTDNEAQFAADAFDGKQFEGTIHVRIYLYGAASDKTVYLKSPISVAGTVAVAPTKYNVTFDANGGSGEMATLKYVEGAEVTLPTCTFTAPTDKEFDAWTSEDVVISENKFTMPAKNVTIKATWKNEIARYTVVYKDGENELGSELVVVGEHPTATGISTFKNYYTFSSWTLAGEAIELSAVEGTKGATVTLDASYVKKYAQSINFEQTVLDEGVKYDIMNRLGTLGYASNITINSNNALDTLNDERGSNRNYEYLGLKVKTNGVMIGMMIKQGSTLKVKFGYIKSANPKASINGGAATDVALVDDVYSYTATEEDAIVTITTASGDAVVFKQIMIDEDVKNIAYSINCATATNGSVSCAWGIAIPGETVNLTVTPNSGYKIVSVSVNEASIEAVNSKYSFTMPAAAANVSAIFDTATDINNTDAAVQTVKVIRNGQLIIIRDGKEFNVLGAAVK